MRSPCAIALGLAVTQVGCATMGASNRSKTLLLMAGVGAAAAVVGYAVAPQDTRPEMSAAYFGAVGAAASGAAGLFIFDEQGRANEWERQSAVMRKELAALRDEVGSPSEPRLLYETSAPFGKEVPAEYAGLVRPGQWSVYRLNQWVTQGEGVIIHQDRMLKLVPPRLTPSSSSSLTGGMGPSAKPPGALDPGGPPHNERQEP